MYILLLISNSLNINDVNIFFFTYNLTRLFFFTSVYVFLGAPKSLVDMMTTMQDLQLFENGDYMVIFADTKTSTVKDAGQYLWSNYYCAHLVIINNEKYR